MFYVVMKSRRQCDKQISPSQHFINLTMGIIKARANGIPSPHHLLTASRTHWLHFMFNKLNIESLNSKMLHQQMDKISKHLSVNLNISADIKYKRARTHTHTWQAHGIRRPKPTDLSSFIHTSSASDTLTKLSCRVMNLGARLPFYLMLFICRQTSVSILIF